MSLGARRVHPGPRAQLWSSVAPDPVRCSVRGRTRTRPLRGLRGPARGLPRRDAVPGRGDGRGRAPVPLPLRAGDHGGGRGVADEVPQPDPARARGLPHHDDGLDAARHRRRGGLYLARGVHPGLPPRVRRRPLDLASPPSTLPHRHAHLRPLPSARWPAAAGPAQDGQRGPRRRDGRAPRVGGRPAGPPRGAADRRAAAPGSSKGSTAGRCGGRSPG